MTYKREREFLSDLLLIILFHPFQGTAKAKFEALGAAGVYISRSPAQVVHNHCILSMPMIHN